MKLPDSPLAVIALGLAALSAIILFAYLLARPPLVRATKLWLLLGLGILPIGAAFAGNVQGFESTKERVFCGSCHLMSLHEKDSDDFASHSLASRHARNKMFGGENCYGCHADYGMFGTIVTKAGGMRHVWMNLTAYRGTSLDEAKKTIRLREPWKMNGNCMQCHSTRDEASGSRFPIYPVGARGRAGGANQLRERRVPRPRAPILRSDWRGGQSMTPIRARRVLSVSCVSALAALALMSWQLFDPYVVPVIIAMSLGQILGTASFAAYLYVVVDDLLRTQRRAGQKSDKVTGG